MPMETGSVSADTTDFVVGVDKKLWVGSGLFKNCNSLFCTQGADFGTAANILTARIGRPCLMTLQVVPPCWLIGDGFVSWNWVAKCSAHESEFLPSLTSFWTAFDFA